MSKFTILIFILLFIGIIYLIRKIYLTYEKIDILVSIFIFLSLFGIFKLYSFAKNEDSVYG
jgi:type II secretory pathway component PulF